MFSISGDPKWLSVFHPSHTEMVHKKASIATRIFLQTFSLQGEKKKKKAKGKQRAFLYVNTSADLFFKGSKRENCSPCGKRLLESTHASVCVSFGFQILRLCPGR